MDGTEPIEPLAASEVGQWEAEVDVVVVGLGCAGTCAAIEAAEAGASVLAVDRTSSGGGTSANSGGIMYLGGGTDLQRACGFEDDPNEMYRFLRAACGPGTDHDKLRTYCDNSPAHYRWLVDHGLPFRAEFYPERDREPPTEAGLLYSGGEDSWPFTDIALPAPRGHHPEYRDAAGGFIMRRLLDALGRTPTLVRTDHRVDRLVLDDGAVVGVLATEAGEQRAFRARSGVVLTAGGFILNPAMIERHAPDAARCQFPVGTDTDDGLGIRLGQGVGAATVDMDAIECSLPLNPPRAISKGIIVNGAGSRVVNEDTYNGRIGLELLRNHDGVGFLIADEENYTVNAVGMRANWVCETVAELEDEIGLPAGSLQATLDRYNAGAAHAEDPDFHKVPDLVVPLEPPLGAIDLRVDQAIYATFTLGGLATDAEGAALDAAGRPIPGLLAAGRTTAGIARRGYVSGISLGDSTFFGRAAGRRAAARA